jgi:DNA gyrase subunit A
VISISTSERNGKVVSAVLVDDTDDLMLMTDQGVLVRTPVCQVRETGRSAQGVKLINLSKGESLVTVQTIEVSEDDEIIGSELVDGEVIEGTVEELLDSDADKPSSIDENDGVIE